MFSHNSHCPDCGQQWFPSLELGHWLYQTELIENEYYQVFLDYINRAHYSPECYPDNPANRSIVLPWSFPLEWTPQNLTRWTFEKACHPFLLGPALVRKRIHDSRVAGFNPALQLILTRTDKTLNKNLAKASNLCNSQNHGDFREFCVNSPGKMNNHSYLFWLSHYFSSFFLFLFW
uniref:Uncharacterized protein n=1 Tax=Nannospalax galili TaxID=1026970 RepID=A0A8C6QBT1_NANGA